MMLRAAAMGGLVCSLLGCASMERPVQCCCATPPPSSTPSSTTSPVNGSGTSAALPSASAAFLVDAQGGVVGQYFAGPAGGIPAMAMVKLPDDTYFTLWVNGSQGQIRPVKGLVYSARSDCKAPYYVERHDEWQAPYPGALIGEVRTVQGRKMLFASRGKWQELPAGTQLYVVGPCTPTYGYAREVSVVEKVYDLSGRLTEPFSLR